MRACRKRAEEREAEEGDEGEAEDKYEARRRKRLERDPLHQGLIVARSELKGREYQLDLASRLGKTQVGGWVGGHQPHHTTPTAAQCGCVLDAA